MKLENRTQLTLLREQCQEKRNKETCKILVCGGTGCLAGGSDKIFDRFSELTAGMDHVEVRIGAEIAHGEHVGVISNTAFSNASYAPTASASSICSASM